MNYILLPWPDRAVHPNSRVHWSKRSAATKRMRANACVIAKAAKMTVGDGPIHVSLTFYPPNKARRDLDGCVSSCKAYLDGLADALGVDDNRFTLSQCLSDSIVKGGEVKIEVVG